MEMTIGMWVTLVSGVAPLVVYWLLWWCNDLFYTLPLKFRWYGNGSVSKLPPGNMGLPFFGELFHFLWYFKLVCRPDDFINSKRKKYGEAAGFYRTHLFGSPAIVSCSPSVNKFVFQSDDKFVVKRPNVEILGGGSLATVEGAIRFRSFASRAVNQPDALRRIAPLLQPSLISALQSWAHKGRVVGFKEAKLVTFQIMVKLFVGIDPGPVTNDLEGFFQGLIHGFRAYPINFPGTAYHHALQCRRKVIEIFKAELERKRKKENREEEVMEDLLDEMMKVKDEQGNQILSDNDIVDDLINLVVAAYESTSLSLTWSLYFLAKNPNVLQKLREENIPLSKDKSGEFIQLDDIAKLKYTNMVVEETIRMANISSMTFRTAAEDVEYKGYKIPKGWKVILFIRYLHTDPENFDDPMCFNPDRWNESVKRTAYQVFGVGSRMCIGNMLARMEIAIFIHYLVAGYKWELVNPDAKIDYLSHPKPVDDVEITISKI